jgi:hypothetical protein
MTEANINIVVGDLFKNFNKIPLCILYSDWSERKLVENSQFKDKIFIPGLGLNKLQIAAVNSSLPEDLKYNKEMNLATNSQTHKYNSDNILVTEPIDIGNSIYESKLIIQDNNELMLDHTTGYHIQGMIFLEATRQMATTIVDKLFNTEDQYYLMHEIKANYFKIAYPIETTIQLELIEKEAEGAKQVFAVYLNFFQNGKKVVNTSGSFTSTDKEKFAANEEYYAGVTAKKIISKFYQEMITLEDNQEMSEMMTA